MFYMYTIQPVLHVHVLCLNNRWEPLQLLRETRNLWVFFTCTCKAELEWCNLPFSKCW